MIKLLVNEIEDEYIQDNFNKLQSYINNEVILRPMWFFVDLTFTGPTIDRLVRHDLKTIPLDVLETYRTGAGSITWEYDKFSRDFIKVSASGPCRVRAFIGRYQERD
jgi:hypothetical protein